MRKYQEKIKERAIQLSEWLPYDTAMRVAEEESLLVGTLDEDLKRWKEKMHEVSVFDDQFWELWVYFFVR